MSPVLHLWGRLSSINVRKVVLAAQELSLPLQRTEAGGAHGRVREAAYLKLNPNGMVPLLQDDQVTLWESNVIVRYLCARHATPALYPQDLPQRFEAEKWMDWQQTAFNPAGRDAFLQLVRIPAGQRDPARIADSVAATHANLQILEQALAGRDFLLGEHFSMADIPLVCEIDRWWGLPLARQPWPNIEQWYARIRQRPSAGGVLGLTAA